MQRTELGQFIRENRIRSGKSLKEVAHVLNLIHQGISQWEWGTRLPPLKHVPELARQIGVDAEELRKRIIEVKAMIHVPNRDMPTNIAPLIKALANLDSEIITMDDFYTLFRIQEQLAQPMTATLITEVLRCRQIPSSH